MCGKGLGRMEVWVVGVVGHPSPSAIHARLPADRRARLGSSPRTSIFLGGSPHGASRQAPSSARAERQARRGPERVRRAGPGRSSSGVADRLQFRRSARNHPILLADRPRMRFSHPGHRLAQGGRIVVRSKGACRVDRRRLSSGAAGDLQPRRPARNHPSLWWTASQAPSSRPPPWARAERQACCGA